MGEGDAIKAQATLEERERIVEVIRRHKSLFERIGSEHIMDGDISKAKADILATVLEEIGVDPGGKSPYRAALEEIVSGGITHTEAIAIAMDALGVSQGELQ